MKTASFWLTNQLSKLSALLDQERKIGVGILEILFEIEQRKSYSELGYDGLFSFCVKELKFTESQAFQRIQAMRALRSTPELKEKIKSGVLNVSTVSQVQIFLRQEQTQGITRSAEEKKDLFQQFENKTSKEVKSTLQELKGMRIQTKLFLELDEECETLWKAFKSKSVHQTQGDDLNAFKLLLRTWLKVNEKKTGQVKTEDLNANTPKPKADSLEQRKAASLTSNHTKSSNLRRSISGSTQVASCPSRHVPIATRRFVFARDQFKCTACHSEHALTIEHILPFAKGGKHEPENLKLLCRNCNLHQGVKQFGTHAMRRDAGKFFN